MPAMILADGLLGQMMEPVVFPEITVTQHPKPWALTGHQNRRPHNIINSLHLEASELEPQVVERFRRYAEIEKNEVRFEDYLTDDADIVVVAYGASSRIVRSAVDAAREQGIRAGLFRPQRVWPFPTEALRKRAETAKSLLVVEMSMGQMVYDVKLAVEHKVPVHFYGRTGGIVPTPSEVLEEIRVLAGGIR